MFVGNASQHIVLVEPLEQGCQLTVPPLGGVDFPLDAGNLLPGFGGVLADDMLDKELFLLPGIMGRPFQIIQQEAYRWSLCLVGMLCF